MRTTPRESYWQLMAAKGETGFFQECGPWLAVHAPVAAPIPMCVWAALTRCSGLQIFKNEKDMMLKGECVLGVLGEFKGSEYDQNALCTCMAFFLHLILFLIVSMCVSL